MVEPVLAQIWASDIALASRVEDASLNASAPPQQHWLDGWLVRYSPGTAKRARSINAVAQGRMSVPEKLRLAEPIYRQAGLELMVRITPFSQPEGLDAMLAAMGLNVLDDTRVMISGHLQALPATPLPAGCRWEPTDHNRFAQVVGQLRGSPEDHCAAHAQRLLASPVPYQGWLVYSNDSQDILGCAQIAIEADMAGLYDVFTAPAARGRGIAAALCAHLLRCAATQGASVAYLQVDSDNIAARKVYQQLGFADAYSYHYRVASE